MEYIKISLQITKDQNEWLNKREYSKSKFIRRLLQEEIDKKS